jgi:transcriptional regulator with XRE-family HTH domain
VLREATGLTQLELAAMSDLTHEEISMLECGKRAPTAKTVRKLARGLRVNPMRFVDSEQVAALGLPVAVAANRLGVPAQRLQTWLRQGQLEGFKVSGEWRVPVASVVNLARSGRMRGRSGRLDPRYRG